MLDDMRVLRDAVAEYRVAATAAGITWPERAEPPGGQPPGLVYRLFDVDHVAEQLTWIESQGWHLQRLLPNGGWVMPWPTDGGEALENLSFSIGTPFPWRHQLPLFHFDVLLYTFVLAGEHEGEIWRYEIAPDARDPVRAATSLAALFTEWTKGIAADVVVYNDLNGWLQVGDGARRDIDMLLERVPDLDPLAFPVSMPEQPLLRARQRECGVDMTCIDRGFDCHEELLDAIAATRASLGT
ncbi:hypothetical protein [Micromonospora sp. NPDC051296]|uniref:hypothetical protein n=1 Tax=Micromonospora sp. NPDC051296 TaxID=3155046 RepID=UPI003425173F